MLKGGMLVASIVGLETRATMDIDTTVRSLNLTLEELDAEETAVYGVRIVIQPQSDENEKVSFLEKGTYAGQLTVKITDKATKKAE